MPSLRITTGTLRGRKIPLPPHTRPTSERARQAFFNILGERIAGAAFLDLFAGSGAFAFEALSRGAASAVAIDESRHNIEAIERLATSWGVPLKAIRSDAIAGIKRVASQVFDVIYADPPYDYERYDDLLIAIDRQLQLADAAVVAIEHRRKTQPFTAPLTRLRFDRRAEYGEVWISLFLHDRS
ncbi:MAG: 16S rRNA (guanine(966)-N(2))-methyltransferase RsmD [Thermoanaerobaculia bacterium]